MTSILLDVLRVALVWLFAGYTLMAVSHLLIQLYLAHRTYRRQASPEHARQFPDLPLSVDVIIPSYNEDPAILEACVRSALHQDHPGPIRVIVVDDGSPNRPTLDPVYRRLKRAGAIVIKLDKNVGKRHAQGAGLDRCTSEIVLTLDSDSALRPDAIRKLTRRFGDARVGAVTGFVDVENERKNLLTRLQRLRYWMAFNQERAAQESVRTVLCLSGPLAAYRRAILNEVRDRYLSQMYGGVPCTFGDDRHLTNLVLGEGYDTAFEAAAVAMTQVPETMRQFMRQQLRWSKSFFRELVWTVPYIGERPWFSRFDLACQVAMPLVLPISATTALVLGLFADPLYLIRFLGLIAVVGALRATYGALRNRSVRFYLFVLYAFVSAFILVPIRFRALWTLTDARWGTRGPKGKRAARWAVRGLLGS
jgi:hyaluronan synthase/N-acetylglucosaminyltransferase